MPTARTTSTIGSALLLSLSIPLAVSGCGKQLHPGTVPPAYCPSGLEGRPLPTQPSKEDALHMMAEMNPAASKCGGTGDATFELHFAPDGRVVALRVDAPSAKPQVERCLLEVFARACLPPFTNRRFTLKFPARL